MDDVPVKPKRSPMFYVGIGCAVIAAIMVVMMGACGVWIFSEVRQLEQDMNDPEARARRRARHPRHRRAARRLLPHGRDVGAVRHAHGHINEPRTDADGGPPETFGERGFIFAEMIRFGRRDEAAATRLLRGPH